MMNLAPWLLAGLLSAIPVPCEKLAGLAVENGAVTTAEAVPAGDWIDPAGNPQRRLPAFCRLQMELSGGTGSAIRVEAWLPESWNGRLLGTGNGSYAGEIQYGWTALALGQGYAIVNDDMGTAPAKGMDGAPIAGRPVKWVDFGWRATHLAAVAGRKVVAARYGRPPHHAYFVGCSTGGRQALVEAQRFPEDYDGVVAGCAARDFTGAILQVAWEHRALRETPGSLPSLEQGAALRKAVLDGCGPTDAGPDGERWLVDPSRCTFDPGTLLCRGAEASDCLTEAQVAAVRRIYGGPTRSPSGAARYPGIPRGAEAPRYWAFLAGQPSPPWDGIYRWVLGDAWDPARLDLDRDQASVEAVLGPLLDVTSGDFSRFARRGGKMILWHGWRDYVNPPGTTMELFGRLSGAPPGGKGPSRDAFARLYLVPGVGHCAGGPGADAFGVARPSASPDPAHDMLSALVRWVEEGVAPGRIVASKLKDDDDPAKGIAFQRPLCPYPSVARYRGTGDRTLASSFDCSKAP